VVSFSSLEDAGDVSMDGKLRISISSPPDRERLVADIFVGNVQWAELNQETGELTFEFYPRPDGKFWQLDYVFVMQALQLAKARLLEHSHPFPSVRQDGE
jgi:hypothetical protein